jgi:hypothetical protein
MSGTSLHAPHGLEVSYRPSPSASFGGCREGDLDQQDRQNEDVEREETAKDPQDDIHHAYVLPQRRMESQNEIATFFQLVFNES